MIESGADEVLVALVLGMDRYCGVTEHRLDASGRDDDVRLVVVERAVAQGNQLTLDVLELHLDVGDRGLQHRRPVHETLGAVDQALVEHALEDGLDGAGEALVHRETITTPVDAVTDAPHLATDGSTGFALPVPDLVDEQLAAEIFLGLSVGSELLLDDGLRGDTGVVHAWQPQHLVALHPLATAEHVHEGVIQGMAHVQAAGDVRGRQHDGVAGLVAGRVGLEVPGVYPA